MDIVKSISKLILLAIGIGCWYLAVKYQQPYWFIATGWSFRSAFES